MNVYQVGRDSLGYEQDDTYEWVVYDYTNDGYDGYGTLVAYKDRELYEQNLGHCSCYGPGENSEIKFIMTKQEYLDENKTIFDDFDGPINTKVRELLGV